MAKSQTLGPLSVGNTIEKITIHTISYTHTPSPILQTSPSYKSPSTQESSKIPHPTKTSKEKLQHPSSNQSIFSIFSIGKVFHLDGPLPHPNPAPSNPFPFPVPYNSSTVQAKPRFLTVRKSSLALHFVSRISLFRISCLVSRISCFVCCVSYVMSRISHGKKT